MYGFSFFFRFSPINVGFIKGTVLGFEMSEIMWVPVHVVLSHRRRLSFRFAKLDPTYTRCVHGVSRRIVKGVSMAFPLFFHLSHFYS
jgi:hypothetical protein